MNDVIQCLINDTISEIENQSQNKNGRPYLAVLFEGMSLRGLYDTGADLSCISEKAFRRIPPEKRPAKLPDTTQAKLKSASGDQLEVRGKYSLKIKLGHNEVQHSFFVIRNLNDDLILGIDFIHKHQLNYNPINRSFRWKGGPAWQEGQLKVCKALSIEALGSQMV